ncbi:3-carboxy-cis,cis-muconate cycloisomerase [Sarocladium strictum]
MGSVSAFDSFLYRNIFGTDEIRKVFTDTAFTTTCIEVETALARAQAKCNVIPQDAADTITAKARFDQLDIDRLRDETEIVGYPILPLVRQLADACGESGRYVHWGATTQDIMDTASVLQMRRGLDIVENKIEAVIIALESLARQYRDTPMAGRTHLQHALPVTFGYKAAVWVSSFYRHRQRLQQLRVRTLLVQYGGAAGTLASLAGPKGDEGVAVRTALAKELDLIDPSITWHVARDGVAETTNFLAIVGGSLGKIALDLMIMCSNELGEVAEPFVPHRGASSTMPQKRNPISSEIILAASKLLRSNASLVQDGIVSDFERASGPWHLEWVCIPQSFVVAVGALHQAAFALSGLVVDEERMLANLNSTKGLIVGEAVMMALARHIGRQEAHDVVYAACKEAIEKKKTLLEVLQKQDQVVKALGREKIESLCDPANYLGASMRMVDDTLALGQ